MSTTWVRVVYGVVLALVLMFTAQFGIAMAIHPPSPPDDPGISFRQLTAGDSDSGQNTLTASIDRYYSDSKDFRDDFVKYQRNVFLAGAAVAALLALIGVLLPTSVNYLRWGFLLGAAFVLLGAGYVTVSSVPNPAPAANSVLALVAAGEPAPLDFAGRFLRFAVSFVTLIVLLFVGLWRLTEWPASPRKVAVAAPASAPTAATSTAWAPPPGTPAPAAAPTRRMEPEDLPPRTATTAQTEGVAAPQPPAQSPPVPPQVEVWQRPAEGDEGSRRPDPAP